MLGMIIKILIATITGYISFVFQWWAPILTFPLVFLLTPNFDISDYYQLSKIALESRRAIFYLVGLCFMGLMTYTFQVRIGNWYGWIVGMALAWLGCGSIAADLEKYLFFRQD